MENFTMIPNELTLDKNLSAKAKGVYNYLKSKPDNWKFYITEIIEHFTDGKEAIYSAIKELINEGWLIKTVIREKGMFVATNYKVLTEKALTANGKAVNGLIKNGLTKNGKPATNNIENNNTDNNNTEREKPADVTSYFGTPIKQKGEIDEVDNFIAEWNKLGCVLQITEKENLSSWHITAIKNLIADYKLEDIFNAVKEKKSYTGKELIKGKKFFAGITQIDNGKIAEVVKAYLLSKKDKPDYEALRKKQDEMLDDFYKLVEVD
jgi:hypothetical protein